jgi:hypothetical protein
MTITQQRTGAGIGMLRSVAFFGLNTFIELYRIRHLHASRGLAGVALTAFLAGGAAGRCSAAGYRTFWPVIQETRVPTAALAGESAPANATRRPRAAGIQSVPTP